MPYNIILTLFSIFLLNLTSSFSQKEDHIWLLGYSEEIEPPDSSFGGVNFDFNKIPMEVNYIKRKNHFWHTNASICNTNGELLCFTNGIYIGNNEYDIMDNGDNIHKWRNRGYGLEQGAIILPYPNQEDQFFAIQGSWERFWVNGRSNIVMNDFRYSLVDMTKNVGLGSVIDKNSLICDIEMNFGFINACQHGNGYDWWITTIKHDSDTVLVFLLDSIGISIKHKYKSDHVIFDGVGTGVFSPNGVKYINVKGIWINKGYYIDIFDFDRCTGELDNHFHFYDDPVLDTSSTISAAVSPNSRYLYVSNTWHIFQYDLEADDIQSSRQTVLKWDGFFDLNPTAFDKMQLAPDGKIYVSSPGGSHYFHVIHAPDSVGVDCRAEQRAIKLPAWNNGTIPNFPHFRMGKIEGTPCDSITASVDIEEENTHVQVSAHPNPSNGLFSVKIDGSDLLDWRYELVDIYGQMLKQKSGILNSNEIELDLQPYPKGVYFLKLIDDHNQIIKVKRLVVQ